MLTSQTPSQDQAADQAVDQAAGLGTGLSIPVSTKRQWVIERIKTGYILSLRHRVATRLACVH